MYTQCPDCGTVFRVTPTVLRAARGQVRCGVCDATFDAIAYLTEMVEPIDQARATQSETTGSPAQPASQAAMPEVSHALAAAQASAPLAESAAASAPHEPALDEIAALIARAAAADGASLHAGPPAGVGRPAETEPPTGAADLVEDEIVLESQIPLEAGRSAPAVPPPDTDWLFEGESAPGTESPRETKPDPDTKPAPAAESSSESEASAAYSQAETQWLMEAEAFFAAEMVSETGASVATALIAAQRPADGAATALAAAPNNTVAAVLATTDDIPDSALEFNAAVTDWDRVFVADQSAIRLSALDVELASTPYDGEDPLDVTGEYPPLELDDGPPGDAEPAPAADPHPEPAASTSAPASTTASAPPGLHYPETPAAVPLDDESDADLAALRRRLAGQLDRAPATASDDEPDAAALAASERATAPRSPARLGLAAGAVLLALGLSAQAVHYWRDSLAGQPLIGAPLVRLYERLGEPLEPRWSLAAYDVKQWGAASDARPGALRVRASVVNRATGAQPYPLLRVTFVDRFGGQVARRDFRPAEYLPGRAVPTQLLAAGARADADLSIVDPGTQAAGFELDVCLARHGVTTCGSELRLAGGGS